LDDLENKCFKSKSANFILTLKKIFFFAMKLKTENFLFKSLIFYSLFVSCLIKKSKHLSLSLWVYFVVIIKGSYTNLELASV